VASPPAVKTYCIRRAQTGLTGGGRRIVLAAESGDRGPSGAAT
jgi:hypothetical protein